MSALCKELDFCMPPGTLSDVWSKYKDSMNESTTIRYSKPAPPASNHPSPLFSEDTLLCKDEWFCGLFQFLYQRDDMHQDVFKELTDIFPEPTYSWTVVGMAASALDSLVAHCKLKCRGIDGSLNNLKQALVVCGLWFQILRHYLSMRYHGATQELCTDASCTAPYLPFAMIRRDIYTLTPKTEWQNCFFSAFLSDIMTYDVSSKDLYLKVLQSLWLSSVYYTLKILFHNKLHLAELLRSEALFVMKRLFDVQDLTEHENHIHMIYKDQLEDIHMVNSRPDPELWAPFMGTGAQRRKCNNNTHRLFYDLCNVDGYIITPLYDLLPETLIDDSLPARRDMLYASKLTVVLKRLSDEIYISDDSEEDEEYTKNIFRMPPGKRRRLDSDEEVSTSMAVEGEQEDCVEVQPRKAAPAKSLILDLFDHSAEESEFSDGTDSFINDDEDDLTCEESTLEEDENEI
ncbi:ORF40 [Ranid herpesvirus 2]|uniref:ORF40 n=1 Tax=Ranid herpesvirus 2 TaxID=389214 RepID=Q14W66_9VIRU|nr:ORF40 [Ranid herpesvirus 2]ABG25603.1 ORF40 [Ranid herpesvirus 2]